LWSHYYTFGIHIYPAHFKTTKFGYASVTYKLWTLWLIKIDTVPNPSEWNLKLEIKLISKATNINLILQRVWRYQRGNQNPYIEEEQTTQWPKEKVQRDKQRPTKHTYTTKDRVTRTSIIRSELRCSGRVNSSYFTSVTRSANLVTHPVISREWERTGKCLRQVEHIFGHLWQRYSIEVNQVMVAIVKLTKWWLQLANGSLWFSRFLVNSNPLSRKSWKEPQDLEYRIIFICRYCWNVATHKWKVHNGKIEIISFVVKLVLNRLSLLISRCRSRYEADLSVSVVSFI